MIRIDVSVPLNEGDPTRIDELLTAEGYRRLQYVHNVNITGKDVYYVRNDFNILYRNG